MSDGKMVSIAAADGGQFNGYLALPKGGAAPGVLIIQEIFGVNAHIRDVVEEYAANGYVALAPDVFWRVEPNLQLDYTPEGIQKARTLRGKFDLNLGMSDIAATIEALKAAPSMQRKSRRSRLLLRRVYRISDRRAHRRCRGVMLLRRRNRRLSRRGGRGEMSDSVSLRRRRPGNSDGRSRQDPGRVRGPQGRRSLRV